MNPSNMLQRMCHDLLTNGDRKAIVKARGFPEAATNPGILTGLFLTESGLADAFKLLTPAEIAALYLLKATDRPVEISFFERVYPAPSGRRLSFTQRYTAVLAKVKERLVRNGLLLMSDVKSTQGQPKMELWRFALPVQFHPHLPPLLESLRTFDGPGNCRWQTVREKMLADLNGAASTAPAKDSRIPRFRVVDGELQLGSARFRSRQVADLQIALWARQLDPQKANAAERDPDFVGPPQATVQLFSSLAENQWAQPEQIDNVIQAFTGQKIDCEVLCEAGWQVGMLAKHETDGKRWYRLVPAEPTRAPQQYLEVIDQDQYTTIDLSLVPYTALEMLVQLGDVRPHPTRTNRLLLTPNLVRLGRANNDLLNGEEAIWLFRHSPAFQQAHDVLISRRGKTVLHSHVMIARVTDLSLKVALEKFFGGRLISLANDYVVFPRGDLNDVRRIVKKSGHVIKEVVNDGS